MQFVLLYCPIYSTVLFTTDVVNQHQYRIKEVKYCENDVLWPLYCWSTNIAQTPFPCPFFCKAFYSFRFKQPEARKDIYQHPNT